MKKLKKVAILNLILYVPACFAAGFVYLHVQEDIWVRILIQLILVCAITSGAYLALMILKAQTK